MHNVSWAVGEKGKSLSHGKGGLSAVTALDNQLPIKGMRDSIASPANAELILVRGFVECVAGRTHASPAVSSQSFLDWTETNKTRGVQPEVESERTISQWRRPTYTLSVADFEPLLNGMPLEPVAMARTHSGMRSVLLIKGM